MLMGTRFGWTMVTMGTVAVLAALPAAAADTDQYGSLATGMPYDREIRVGPNTKRVGVWRLETIRFLTTEGREFRWRFDARHLDVFPLARIAPSELAVPSGTTVYVNGELPVSDF
jgi:hypothetical protein